MHSRCRITLMGVSTYFIHACTTQTRTSDSIKGPRTRVNTCLWLLGHSTLDGTQFQLRGLWGAEIVLSILPASSVHLCVCVSVWDVSK
jgi:hypothetical protein